MFSTPLPMNNERSLRLNIEIKSRGANCPATPCRPAPASPPPAAGSGQRETISAARRFVVYCLAADATNHPTSGEPPRPMIGAYYTAPARIYNLPAC